MQQSSLSGEQIEGLPWPDQPYQFSSQAEADATYLVIAWFAITEAASLGIFPLLPALETTRREADPTFFARFFEHGFQHFTDEQNHANLWCRTLMDFTQRYPEVVQRVSLPQRYLKIMLKSIGKPHDVQGFAIDCLAFEVVMQALYEMLAARLVYPPVLHVLEVISRDERDHTLFGRHYLSDLFVPSRGWRRWTLGFRYWRNTLGVTLTVEPMLKAVNRHQPIPAGEFRRKLAHYARNTGLAGQNLVPNLLLRLG